MNVTMTADPITEDAAWRAVLERDRSYDGRFVTGVLSTGIYCRPSCAARHPRRENVRFYADGDAARGRGCGRAGAASPTTFRATSARCWRPSRRSRRVKSRWCWRASRRTAAIRSRTSSGCSLG